MDTDQHQEDINQDFYMVSRRNLGMSLRDYFAAKAMQGIATHSVGNYLKVAEWSYGIADAMLTEREKK